VGDWLTALAVLVFPLVVFGGRVLVLLTTGRGGVSERELNAHLAIALLAAGAAAGWLIGRLV
jgi:hypothetical protein